jgi:unsaturated rhamnogalacturonyl hydrolase
MLQILPANHPDRPFFVEQFKQMCEKVIAIQPADGVWRASLLDPDNFPLQEASGTGFFCYGLAYGINNKLLDASKARPALEKAFSMLCSFVTPEGKLTHVQPPGVDPKTFDINTSDVYGVGAFLLAGSEIFKFDKPLTFSTSRSEQGKGT